MTVTVAGWVVGVQLLFCAALMGAAPVTEPHAAVCRTDDLMKIQSTCRVQNTALLDAETAHDEGLLCKSLFDLWYCVAGHVPQCFNNLTDIYRNYLHSPHNCHLSNEHVLALQGLMKKTASNQGNGDVTVSLNNIAPETSSPTASPKGGASSSSSSGEEEEEEEGYEVGTGSEEVTIVVHEKGGTHKHTGNGSSTLGLSTIPLVVMSWLMTSQMTSYLLHS